MTRIRPPRSNRKCCWRCTKGMHDRCSGFRQIVHIGKMPCECACVAVNNSSTKHP